MYNNFIKSSKNSPTLVRCSALHQIKSYDPQLKKFTVNSLDFRLCSITCQVENFRVNFRLNVLIIHQLNLKKAFKICISSYYYFNKSNLHWSGRGLLGWQIPFEPHALALQSQYKVVKSFHLLAISYIFTNFTFTYKVSLTPSIF